MRRIVFSAAGRNAIAGVFLAILCAAPLTRVPSDSGFSEFVNRDYRNAGEMLLHGVQTLRGDGTFHMPLSNISMALIFNHLAVPPLLLRMLFPYLTIILLLAVCCMLQPFAGLSAPAALLIFNSSGLYSTNPLELMFSVFILMAAGLLVWRARFPSWRRSLVLGLFVGATILYRSTLAFFLPLLAICEWVFWARFSLRSYWKHLLLLCFLPYLFLIPWVRLNWKMHHSFAPFEYGQADENIITGALGLVHTIDPGARSLIENPGGKSQEIGIFGWAVREVAHHPDRYATAFVKRIRFAILLHPFLFLAAFISIWAQRRKMEILAVGLLAFYFVAMHCLMSVQARYFEPLWPLLCVLAASLAGRLVTKDEVRIGSFEYRFSKGVLQTGFVLVLAAALYCSYVTGARVGIMASHPPGDQAALDHAIALSPRDAWLFSERGSLRLSRGDVGGAISDLAEAFALEPGSRQRKLDLAWALTFRGEFSLLLGWDFQPASVEGASNNDFQAHILIADAYLRLGKNAHSREHLKAALDSEEEKEISGNRMMTGPEREKNRLLHASAGSFMARLDDVLAGMSLRDKFNLLKEVAKLEPKFMSFWIDQAVVAARLGERAGAIESLARAESLNPTVDEQRRVAEIYAGLKEYSRAMRIWRSLNRRFPDDAEIWTKQAEAAIRAGNRAEALDCLARVEGLAPNLERQRRLAQLYQELKDYPRAFRILESIGRRFPHDSGVLMEQAEAAFLMGRPNEAMGFLARAEGLRPGREERHRIALAYQSLKNYPEAIRILEQLTLEKPKTAEYFADLGLCKYLNHATQGTVENLKTAISLDPGLFSAYLTLGAIYTGQRKYAQARELYDAALAVGPLKAEDKALNDSIRKAREEIAAEHR